MPEEDEPRFTTDQVAEMTGRKKWNIIKIAQRHNLGTRLSWQRLFTQADVDFIKSLDPRGARKRKDGQPTHWKTPLEATIAKREAIGKANADRYRKLREERENQD